MFTGLVAGTGKLVSRDKRGPGYRMVIGNGGLSGFDQLELGESIAVNGACLTVVSQSVSSFDVEVSAETADKTTLGRLPLGTDVNLERALRVGDRLGGHWVSGHVDGVGRIGAVEAQGDAWLVKVLFGEEHRRFIAAKGSITLDGVSLTVNDVRACELSVMLIPHTREVTALRHWRAGAELNLEVDLVARYLVSYFEATAGSGQNPGAAADARFALALERAGYK